MESRRARIEQLRATTGSSVSGMRTLNAGANADRAIVDTVAMPNSTSTSIAWWASESGTNISTPADPQMRPATVTATM